MKRKKTSTHKPSYTQLLQPAILPNGEQVSSLGQGTWFMGENSQHRRTEVSSLRYGIELGMSLVDTAEMYANGGAEEIVGEAISGQRQHVFLVSKVLPINASRDKMTVACENSLKRLKTDYLDMYLLHWRGTIPLLETIETFHRLVEDGKIRYWGVSNFDIHDMRELVSLPGGPQVATNQVLYNLAHRGIEYNLMPWCLRHNLPIMAYSPINRGDISHPVLNRIASRHGPTTTPFQVALAWVLMHEQVIAIPKATERAHVFENRQALDLKLTNEDLDELNQAFPAPRREIPLEMI